ncbi:MAG: hypothetical protein H6Q41_1728 [Deltaproteobacteria bacterium]|nr:hypothetical protein [Deltaproteobacteria bacterium]
MKKEDRTFIVSNYESIEGLVVVFAYARNVLCAARRKGSASPPMELHDRRIINSIVKPLHRGRPFCWGKRISFWIIFPFPQ